MASKTKIDRLSELPDSLLCSHILSNLTLRDAIRSSILSRRWRSLWTQIPHLHFTRDFDDYMPPTPSYFHRNADNLTPAMRLEIEISTEYIKAVIYNVLSLHAAPLESFRFHLFFVPGQANFDQWINCAALRGVKQMDLSNFHEELDLPPPLFACHLLTDLRLGCFNFTGVPTDFGGFPSLKTCSLWGVDNFTDDGLQQLIALSPLLQKLVLTDCTELVDLKICASNLNHFSLEASRALTLTLDCPQLIELKVEDCDRLSKLKLNSCELLQLLHTSKVPSHERPSTLKSLKKLSLKKTIRVPDPPFLAFVGRFPDLEELEVTAIFIQDMADYQTVPEQESTAGKVISDLAFPNLKIAYVDIASEMGDKVVALLRFLLRNAPSLKTLALDLSFCPEDISTQQFIIQVLDLKPVSADVEIRIVREDQYGNMQAGRI